MIYYIISWFLEILIIVVPLLVAVAYFTLAERKVIAKIWQSTKWVKVDSVGERPHFWVDGDISFYWDVYWFVVDEIYNELLWETIWANKFWIVWEEGSEL